MKHPLLLSLLFPLFACGQSGKPAAVKGDLTAIYTRAIGDFIQAANKKNGAAFDTLYFIKRQLGQPDDFPDMALPSSIEHTEIRVVSPEASEKLQKEITTRKTINLIGWVEKDTAEFMFVVFSNGFAHQYDYRLNYKYNAKNAAFKLEQVQVKMPPFDK